jgi:hypothetical protein
MQQSRIVKNSQSLERELFWLAKVIDTRFKLHFKLECEHNSIYDIEVPQLKDDASVYARVLRHFQMNYQERLILILSLVPHIRPQLIDIFFTKNEAYDRIYTEFGGLKGKYHSGFLPTGETASFILAGNDLSERIKMVELFRPEHFFAKQNILKLDLHHGNEPLLSSGIEISEEYLSMLTTGKSFKPDFSTNFPAKLLTTRLDWADLVLDPQVLGEISEIAAWIKHQDTIMNEWGLSRMLKRGYRSLFYGPPGTGKTLTACLLGKTLNLDVYRVDLSQVVSKYIGETEKNMASIFDQAENKNWILFFDEADALFGKRTATSDSKDRHANQEVAYLLQRVEDFSGVVILATNLKANMDTAFSRRFQSIVFFPAPNYEQRLRLWRNTFEGQVKLDSDVEFKTLANDYKITGGAIINVLRYCSLSALERGSRHVSMDDIREGVKKELRKEGKTLD